MKVLLFVGAFGAPASYAAPTSWVTIVDKGMSCQGDEFLKNEGTVSTAAECLALVQANPDADYGLWRGDAVTLVLDTEEVHLKRGDTVVQIGGSHAWSNCSDAPCELFISMHDGKA